jgi:hypothetical protein
MGLKADNRQSPEMIPCLAYSSTLSMDVTGSSGPSVNFQRTTCRCILERESPQTSTNVTLSRLP